MAQDLVTRLVLKSDDWQRNLNNTRRQLDDFKKSTSGKALTGGIDSLGKSFGKLIPAIGAVTSAGVAFEKMTTSSRSAAEAFGKTIDATTGVIDSFFHSLTSGNFSSFIDGLGTVINTAQKAYDALEQLKIADILNNPAIESAESEMKQWRSIMEDTTKTYEERVKAKEMALKAGEGLTEIFRDQEAKALEAFNANLDKMIAEKSGGTLNRDLARSMLQSSISYDSNESWVSEYEWQVRELAQKEADKYASEQERIWASDRKRQELLADEEYKVRKAISELTVEQLQTFRDLTDELNSFSLKYVGVMDDINTIRDSKIETASGGGEREKFVINERVGLRSITEGEQETPGDLQIRVSVSPESKQEVITTIATLREQLAREQLNLEYANIEDLEYYRQEISQLESQLYALETPLATLEQSLQDYTMEGISAMSGLISSFSGLGAVMESDSTTLEKLAAGFSMFTQIIQQAQQMISVFNQVQQASIAISQAKSAANANEAITSGVATATKSSGHWIELIAAVGAVMASIISSLAMAKFAGGGIVGGNSAVGDKMLVAVNSGEMILNSTQQSRLFNMLNGANTSMNGGKEVVFRISGRDLIGTMNAENNLIKKSK